jgi:hypothetical protein
MDSKHAHTVGTATSAGTDDLTLINGIGRVVERRLHSASILTFDQLAALSPDDLAARVAGLAGLSTERIIKQDWIGQARELASRLPLAEPQADESSLAKPKDDMTVPTIRQHNANFTVELLLNEYNDVRSTLVTHVQSGGYKRWEGWHDSELIGFFVQHAALRRPPSEHAPPVAAPAKSTPPIVAAETAAPVAVLVETAPPSEVAAGLAGMLRVREFEAVPAGEVAPRRMLRASQPFTIGLTLDLADVTMPDDTLLDYTVTIYAKKMGSRQHQTVTEARGTILAAEAVTVSVEAEPLTQGPYRMEGIVVLTAPDHATTARGGLRAMIEGGLFQVY